MPVSDALREMIVARAATHEIMRQAQLEGMPTLRDAQARRIIPLELEALDDAPPPKASSNDVTIFTRQLAGLLRAGAGTRSGLPRIVNAVARDIIRGEPFSQALAHHPGAFGPLYCQLIAVGEVAGALTYLVILLLLAITLGLLIGVVPTFHFQNDLRQLRCRAARVDTIRARAVGRDRATYRAVRGDVRGNRFDIYALVEMFTGGTRGKPTTSR